MFYSDCMKISGTGHAVPDKVLTNFDLEKSVKTSNEWIVQNLGINRRRVSEKTEMTSDLATIAARRAIENAGLSINDIEMIIVATATPDRKAPSTACLVKNKLQMKNFCPSFDIAAVCSGFMYAMSIASNFIQTKSYKRILIIGADTFSHITDWTRRDCVFFGDGAGAAVLEYTQEKSALFSAKIFSECTNTDNFTVYPHDPFFTMNGRAVYETGIKVLPEAINAVLLEQNIKIDDVKYLIPHQPSIRILQKTAEILGLHPDKLKTNMSEYANTSAGTIPILLDEVQRSKELKKGDILLFAAVGSGWTWGAGVYRCQ